MPATVIHLDDGLVALLLEDHRTDTIAIHLTYGVGSQDEGPGEWGFAHLFEHLMFESSRNVPTGKYDEWLEAAGAENNAYTSEDETEYVASFPSAALDLVLFLESDRLGFLDAELDANNLENQRAVVLRERAEAYREPWGRDADALSLLLWPEDHPYHHSTIGTVDDLLSVSLDTVRSFWERHYRPANAVIALVGHFDTARATERIRHWFSDVPGRGPPVPRAEPPMGGRPVPQSGLVEDGVEEQTVYLAWDLPPRGHPDEPALDLLTRVLSGGRGTRLDDALLFRRALALDLGADAFFGRLAGAFHIYVSSADVALPVLRDAVRHQIERVARRPVDVAALERARAAWRADTLDAVETVEGRAAILSFCYASRGRPDCLAEQWARYDAVTVEDLSRVAATWLGRPPTTLSNVPRGRTDLAIPGSRPVEIP